MIRFLFAVARFPAGGTRELEGARNDPMTQPHPAGLVPSPPARRRDTPQPLFLSPATTLLTVDRRTGFCTTP